MTDEATSLVLEHLRYMRSKIDMVLDRLSRVEMRLSLIEGHFAQVVLSDAAQNSEIDRVNKRLDQIERRLELTN